MSVAPTSPNSCPISSLPLARPHLGKYTCASSANRSRMLPPVDVTPALSNALRYSSATDLRCSSVIVSVLTAMVSPLSGRGDGVGCLLNGLRVGGVRGAVGEGDDGAERRAAGPVRARRRGRDAVADAVQPGDRAVEVVDHLTVGRRLWAALGVERSPRHEGRVIRARCGDRPHGEVLAARLLLDEPVEQLLDGALAAAEVLVHASL